VEENEGVGTSESVQEVVTVAAKRRWVGAFVGGAAVGASVTVYDAAGKVDAVGAITKPYSLGVQGCSFSIVVPDVPDGEKFYQVEVTHRGKITVPADEAKTGMVSLSLGN
jgi:hypothetical protein